MASRFGARWSGFAAFYDPTLAGAVLRIFLSEIERCLQANGPEGARTGAVSFIHRFGAALNPHIHLMCMDAQMPRAHGQMTAPA
jgi:hypothetical protein